MNNKIGFVHLPRTGGTYLEAVLCSCMGPDSFINFFGTPDNQVPNRVGLIEKVGCDNKTRAKLLNVPNWDTCKLFSGHFSLNIEEFLPPQYSYEYITILRNPLTRVFSFVKKVTTSRIFNKVIMQNAKEVGDDIFWNNFIEYVDTNNKRGLSSHERHGFSNYMTKVFSGSDLCADIDVNEELYNKASTRLQNLKYIGLFENYNQAIQNFINILGINPPRYYVKENKNKSVDNIKIKNKLIDMNQYDLRLYEEFSK